MMVGGRFGVLLGLTIWLGLAMGLLFMLPGLYKSAERSQARELASVLMARTDRVLLMGICVLGLSLALQALVHQAPAAGGFWIVMAVMTGLRLIGWLAVGPAARAMQARLRDANAPASNDERRAFERLHTAGMAMLTVELALGVYALFVVS
jgi:hypothetical protein